ncbi:hypothetical protein BCR42DRAFT_401782 [Absidia repens]|uniref:Uncharacterized protein n=1 Tax=Absidia repens TaxID=90262 RepID=A0A1X2J2Z0_9FUNG|nr:hypothetical protein BCR42DRAFT_401782 [Absidia repens]
MAAPHDSLMAVGSELTPSHPSHATAFSTSMYIPPSTAYWSPMYQAPSSQTPIMMGMANPPV